MEERMPRRHRQDIKASLKGILVTVAIILAFILFLILLAVFERWVLS